MLLQIKYNEITYDTTFENYTMLTGNVVSLGMGGIICLVVSLIAPEDYDFISMKQIKMLDDDVGGSKGFTQVSTHILSDRVKACKQVSHFTTCLECLQSKRDSSSIECMKKLRC